MTVMVFTRDDVMIIKIKNVYRIASNETHYLIHTDRGIVQADNVKYKIIVDKLC